MLQEIITNIDIIGLVLSFLIVCLIAYQAVLMRKHNRISVQPRLTYEKILHNSEIIGNEGVDFYLKIKNTGLGPAIITDYSLSYKGDKIASDKDLEKITAEFAGNGKFFRGEPDYFLSPKDSLNLLEIQIPPFNTDTKPLKIEEFAFNINYKSIYGKEFTYNSEKP